MLVSGSCCMSNETGKIKNMSQNSEQMSLKPALRKTENILSSVADVRAASIRTSGGHGFASIAQRYEFNKAIMAM